MKNSGREFRTTFPPRDIRKNPRSMYARVPQAMAQFVLKIELLSHIMGTTPILEMARAYGLRPRLLLLLLNHSCKNAVKVERFFKTYGFISVTTEGMHIIALENDAITASYSTINITYS